MRLPTVCLARMLPDPKEWEEDRPEDAPGLLVSAGTEKADAEMGLGSPLVLD